MAPRFSLVYPTRHRPAFLAEALRLLELQSNKDFEVIVSDNWVDPALSCEAICNRASLPSLKYVRPPSPVGMVANWNYAAQFATGDYVCVFTDKMFLLPDALARAERAIQATRHSDGGEVEILSWVSDAYQPNAYPDYFGAGTYTAVQADADSTDEVVRFSPADELDWKAVGHVSRYEQSPSQYCRGKIVFGAYHRHLIARINERFGQLFHDISPDYTSMVLALSIAKSAIELRSSAVVSISTDLSNGMLGAVHDKHALGYISSLSDDIRVLCDNMLVPGLYASQANVVSHDYLALKRRFDLDVSLDARNWLCHCIEDLGRPDRVWSSAEVEQQQSALMEACVVALAPDDQGQVIQRLEHRFAARSRGKLTTDKPGQRLAWPSPSLASALQRRSAWSF